jgi:ubiquinone biosynthesis protein Coq4
MNSTLALENPLHLSRADALNIAKEMLNEKLDPFELQSLTSFMTILLPSSNDWYEIDKILCSIINEEFLNNNAYTFLSLQNTGKVLIKNMSKF